MALLPSVLTKGSSELYPFTSFTFTTAGVQGQNGPTLSIVQSAYSATSWTQNTAYLNMTTQGIQRWTVPATGIYTITAAGAAGGNGSGSTGGAGAVMTGTFALTQSNVVQILVGQRGVNGSNHGGGGGGTFVVMADGAPLIVAGGGGGGEFSGYGSSRTNKIGVVTTSGQAGVNGANNEVTTSGQGGTNGGGGGTASSQYPGSAGGGGGLTGNGTDAVPVSGYTNAFGGRSFANGGAGGRSAENSTGVAGAGGFGGGGGADWNYYTGAGGGGGYSGGGGGTYYGMGGGGGSYNVGSSQTNTAGNNPAAQGYVTITKA
jgi:hypothetical protein